MGRGLSDYRKKLEEEKKSSSSSGNNSKSRGLDKFRLERNIGFDTLEADLTNMGTTLNNIYSSWQTPETMKNTRASVESMQKRINDYRDYQSKYGSGSSADLDNLASGYQSVLDNWDNLTATYGYFKNADAFDKALKKEQFKEEFGGLSYADVQKKKAEYKPGSAEYDFLSEYGVNAGYSDLREYEAELAGLTDSAYKDQLTEKRNQYALDNKFDLYKHYMDAEDFEEKSVYKAQSAGTFIDKLLGKDETYEWINNANGARIRAKNKASSKGMYMAGGGITKYEDKGYDNLTDEEIGVYNYIYDAEGPEAAQAYLDDMEVTLTKRDYDTQTEKLEKAVDESVVAAAGLSALSVPANIIGSVTGMVDTVGSAIQGKEYNPYSSAKVLSNLSSNTRQFVGENIAESTEGMELWGQNVPSFLYQTVMSMGDSAAAALMGGPLGAAALGSSAANQRAKELKEAGAGEGTILAGALASGTFEMLFEKISLDKLLSNKSVGSLGNFVKETLKQAGVEGSEEIFTETANLVTDALLRGQNSDALKQYNNYLERGFSEKEAGIMVVEEQLNQILWAGIGGALSGGVMGGVVSATDWRGNAKTGKELRSQGLAEDVLEAAGMSPEGSEAYKLHSDATKKNQTADKLGNAQIGNLYNTMNRTAVSDAVEQSRKEGVETVARRLSQLGYKGSDIVEVAEAIMSEKQTSKQKKLIEESGIAQDVLLELEEGKLQDQWKSSEALEKIQNRNYRLGKINRGESVHDKKITERAEAIQKENTDIGSNDALLQAHAETMDEAKKATFLEQSEGVMDVDAYAASFNLVYEYGRTGFDADTALNNRGTLTPAQTAAVYKAGIKHKVAERQRNIDNLVAKYAKDNQIIAGNFDDSIIDYQNKGKGINWNTLTSAQRGSVALAKALSEATGINITLMKSNVGSRGKYEGAAGSYNPNTNTIELDIYSGRINVGDLESAMISTLSHETTHWMKDKAPALYQELTDIVMESLASSLDYTKDGKLSRTELIHREMDRIQKRHPEIDVTEEYAIDELVARACEDMLSNSKAAQELLEQLPEEERKTLYEKFKEVLENLKKWIGELLGQYNAKSQEARILREYEDKLKALQDTWDKAFKASVTANQALQREGVLQEDSTQYSDRQFAEDIKAWTREGKPDGEVFILGTTGDVLQGLGAIESDIYMLGDKIKQILKDHPEMTLDVIKKIPQILESPVLVMESRNTGRGKKDNTRLVMFGSVKAKDGLPVLVALDMRPKEKHLIIEGMQKVTSAYTKDNNPVDFLQKSNVMYVDKKRTTSLLRTIGFQMPIELNESGYVGNITYWRQNVKLFGKPFTEVVDIKKEQKNNRSLATLPSDDKILSQTSETLSGTASDIIISNLSENTTDFSEKYQDRINLVEELSTYNLEGKWNDYIGVQKEVIGVLKEEGYFEDNQVTNASTGMIIRINPKGIKETLGTGKRFQSLPKKLKEFKIATIRSLPRIIETATLVADNVPNKHKENGYEFAYFSNTIQIGSDNVRVRLSVKKKIGTNLFWMHNIDEINKSSELLDPSQEMELKETQNFDSKITHDEDSVNLYFSDRFDNEFFELFAEDNTVEKESKVLGDDLVRLADVIRMTGKKIYSDKLVSKVARYLCTEYNSDYNKETLSKEIAKIYEYIAGGEDLQWNDVMNVCYELAGKVLKEQRGKKIVNDYAKMILKDIRSTTIRLDKAQAEEAKSAYGSNYRFKLGSRVKIDPSGIALSRQWQQWAEQYPDIFDSNITGGDQITALVDLYSDLREASETVQYFRDSDTQRQLALEIYNKFWTLQTEYIQGKYEMDIKTLKAEHRKAMSDLKTENAYAERWFDAEAKEKYGKLVKEIRERKDAKIQEIKTNSKKRMEEYKKRVEKKTVLDRIVKNALQLNKRFKTNSKASNIPEVMKPAVTQLLDSIDFSSKQLLGLRNTSMAFTPTKGDISLSRALEMVKEQAQELSGMEMTMEGIDTAYDGFVGFPPNFIADIEKSVKDANNIMRTVGDNQYILHEMSLEQLESLDNVVATIKHICNEINTLHSTRNKEKMNAVAQESMQYMESMGERNTFGEQIKGFFTWTNVTPINAFKRFGPGGEIIFEALQDAQDTMAFCAKEIMDYAGKAYTAEEALAWQKEVLEFDVIDRTTLEYKTVRMPVSHAMSLYCLSKRKQGLKHILGGGIRVEDFKEGMKKVSQVEGFTLGEPELNAICNALTDKQREAADKLQEFLNTRCSEWANKTSMLLYGIRAFTEKNYFPIRSDRNGLNTDGIQDNVNNIYKLLNMSFTKPLNLEAKNTIIVRDIFDVFAEHTSGVAAYYSFGPAVLDACRWYNYKEKIVANGEGATQHKDKSVKGLMETAYGVEAKKYVEKFLRDINGDTENLGVMDRFAKYMMGNYKKAAVGANIRVCMLQPTAYVRAAVVIEPKYLLQGLRPNQGIEKAKEHCGIALWKSMDYYDVNISRGLKSKIKHDETKAEKAVEKSLELAGKMDEWTWGCLWNACEAEIKDTRKDLKPDSDAYFKAISDRLREIIYKTQVVDSVMTRTQSMREKSFIAQTLTAFMSEPLTSYNMVLSAAWDAMAEKKATGKTSRQTRHQMAKVTMAYVVSSAATAIAGSIMDAVRDDDEEKEFGEAYMEALLDNFLNDLNPLGKLPVVKDFVSINQGFNPTRMDEQVYLSAAYALNAWEKLLEGKGSVYKTIYRTLQTFSQATGIPMSNLFRDVIAFWNNTAGEVWPSVKLK